VADFDDIAVEVVVLLGGEGEAGGRGGVDRGCVGDVGDVEARAAEIAGEGGGEAVVLEVEIQVDAVGVFGGDGAGLDAAVAGGAEEDFDGEGGAEVAGDGPEGDLAGDAGVDQLGDGFDDAFLDP
jgi:hypothetical protein